MTPSYDNKSIADVVIAVDVVVGRRVVVVVKGGVVVVVVVENKAVDLNHGGVVVGCNVGHNKTVVSVVVVVAEVVVEVGS